MANGVCAGRAAVWPLWPRAGADRGKGRPCVNKGLILGIIHLIDHSMIISSSTHSDCLTMMWTSPSWLVMGQTDEHVLEVSLRVPTEIDCVWRQSSNDMQHYQGSTCLYLYVSDTDTLKYSAIKKVLI